STTPESARTYLIDLDGTLISSRVTDVRSRKYRTSSGCTTIAAPKLVRKVLERSKTSTSQPASRRTSAAVRPPIEPPTTATRGIRLIVERAPAAALRGPQGLVDRREALCAGGGDQVRILDADAADFVLVDRGLEVDHHPLPDHEVLPRHDEGR